MGVYDPISVSGYNSNPPSDDGSEVPQNLVTWAGIKSKIGDPLKTAIESGETATEAAFSKMVGGAGVVSSSVDYTVLSTDAGKLVKMTGPDTTLTTPDASVVGSPFVFGASNLSTGLLTLDGNGTQNVDGVASLTIPPGAGTVVYTDGTNWFTTGQNWTRAAPPQSSFKNLSIKVATNTTVTVAADYVTMYNSSGVGLTAAISATCDLGTNGAVNRLDSGTIASATWYSIWAISKDDGTTGVLASTSATAPTLPTDYNYKSRIGWVRTASGVSQLLGTWQLGRRAQYKPGLAQSSNLPALGTGAVGTYSNTTPIWSGQSVSNFVPSTASRIVILGSNNNNSGTLSDVIVAPNDQYGGSSSTNPPPMRLNQAAGAAQIVEFTLESTSIYWASNGAGAAVFCLGWEDNI